MFRLTKLQYVALTFLTLTPAVLTVLMWGGDIPRDPFVFIMLCALTLGLWCPLGLYVSELVNHVDGWEYEAGNYSKYVYYGDECLRVFVERRKHNQPSPYWVSIMADDEDYFGDECITVVNSYGDHGQIVGVLYDAEMTAVRLLLEREPF